MPTSATSGSLAGCARRLPLPSRRTSRAASGWRTCCARWPFRCWASPFPCSSGCRCSSLSERGKRPVEDLVPADAGGELHQHVEGDDGADGDGEPRVALEEERVAEEDEEHELGRSGLDEREPPAGHDPQVADDEEQARGG